MMPEMPEVETMVRDLRTRVIGHVFSDVQAPFRGSVVYPTYEEFAQRVVGTMLIAVERRGKYASIRLQSGDALIVHRGMTGSLLHRSPAEPMESHVRVILTLDDGSHLRFRDQRKFGKLFIMDASGADRTLPWSAFGPEPLEDTWKVADFRRTLVRRTAPIKSLLLGQRIVAGLGNIYVDEALHLARIHPRRPAGSLTRSETGRLHTAVREVLTDAITRRGTTFSNYADLEGREGQYQHELRVFHRTGQPCPRCGAAVQRLVVGGRGTHVCPHCQRI